VQFIGHCSPHHTSRRSRFSCRLRHQHHQHKGEEEDEEEEEEGEEGEGEGEEEGPKMQPNLWWNWLENTMRLWTLCRSH
jgi:TATA-binding protein-associated factor Taf7